MFDIDRDLNFRKEAYSRAYVAAVASTAGFVVQGRDTDLDSVDGTIHARGGTGGIRSPVVDFQLKCTASAPIDDLHVRYRLERKNYDELRADSYLVPRILVLVIVPTDPRDWIVQDEHEMLVRNCGYWRSLMGAESIDGESVTVWVPRSQRFTVESLTFMLERIGSGGVP